MERGRGGSGHAASTHGNSLLKTWNGFIKEMPPLDKNDAKEKDKNETGSIRFTVFYLTQET